jgi:hypothetical protein
MAVAGASNVCVSDLSRATAGHSEQLYQDSGHMTGAGNEVIARHIVHELGACGFLPQ